MAKVKSLKEHKSMTNQGVQTINESIETPSKLLKKKDELISKLKNEIDISTTDIQRLNTDLIHYERVVDELGFVSLFWPGIKPVLENERKRRKRFKERAELAEAKLEQLLSSHEFQLMQNFGNYLSSIT